MIKFLISLFKAKKEPTFIQKVDQWQTEMYNYKSEQERNAHK